MNPYLQIQIDIPTHTTFAIYGVKIDISFTTFLDLYILYCHSFFFVLSKYIMKQYKESNYSKKNNTKNVI
jgi:hypothetical protein